MGLAGVRSEHRTCNCLIFLCSHAWRWLNLPWSTKQAPTKIPGVSPVRSCQEAAKVRSVVINTLCTFDVAQEVGVGVAQGGGGGREMIDHGVTLGGCSLSFLLPCHL